MWSEERLCLLLLLISYQELQCNTSKVLIFGFQSHWPHWLKGPDCSFVVLEFNYWCSSFLNSLFSCKWSPSWIKPIRCMPCTTVHQFCWQRNPPIRLHLGVSNPWLKTVQQAGAWESSCAHQEVLGTPKQCIAYKDILGWWACDTCWYLRVLQSPHALQTSFGPSSSCSIWKC